ncbi:MAG: HIT family protein [Candidatus Woesearchaeota archaeon]
MTECDLCNIEESNPTLIRRSEYWTVLGNYKQPTLGSSLIVLNRHAENLSDLKETECNDYFRTVQDLEWALRQTFAPNMINHLMLGNRVRHVHYHVVPRYENEVRFFGTVWKDENYGKMPILSTEVREPLVVEEVVKTLAMQIVNPKK